MGRSTAMPGRGSVPWPMRWLMRRSRWPSRCAGGRAFLASAWGQRLRAGHWRPFDALLKAPFLRGGTGWADVVAGLLAAFRGATATVWRYEDFSAAEPAVIEALAGPVGALCPPPAAHQLVGFSAAAVARIEAWRTAQGTGHEAGRIPEEVVQAALEAHPKTPGVPPFDPWTPAEHAILAEHDADDLMRLAGLDRVTLLAPDTAGEALARPAARR